jgi:subtilisin-like proprotein convertase family protein
MPGAPTGRIVIDTRLEAPRGVAGIAGEEVWSSVPADTSVGTVIFSGARAGLYYWIRGVCSTGDCWSNFPGSDFGPEGNLGNTVFFGSYTGMTVGRLAIQMPGEAFRQIGEASVLWRASQDGDILGVFPDSYYDDNSGEMPVLVQEVHIRLDGKTGPLDGSVDTLTLYEGDEAGGAIPPYGTSGVVGFYSRIGELGVVNRVDSVELTDLYHPFANDLVITLRSPTGVASRLVNRILGPSEGGGTQAQAFSGTYVFSDSASSELEADAPGGSGILGDGTFKPVDAMDIFVGERVTGPWMLEVRDASQDDTGTLGGWKLNVTHALTDHGIVTPTPRYPMARTEVFYNTDSWSVQDTSGSWSGTIPEEPTIIKVPVTAVGTVLELKHVASYLGTVDIPGSLHMVVMSPSGTQVTVFHRPGFTNSGPSDQGNTSGIYSGLFYFEEEGDELPDSDTMEPGRYGRDPGNWPGGAIPIGSFDDFIGEPCAGIWRVYVYNWYYWWYSSGSDVELRIRYNPD